MSECVFSMLDPQCESYILNTQHLLDKYNLFKMLGGVSLTQHLNEFKALLLALQARRIVVKGEDEVIHLMLSLLPTYFTPTIALTVLSEKLTFAKLKSVLTKEYKIKVRWVMQACLFASIIGGDVSTGAHFLPPAILM